MEAMIHLARFLRLIENRVWWTTCRYVDAREVIQGSLALTVIFFGLLAAIAGAVLTVAL